MAPDALTFGLKESIFAGTRYGEHVITRFKVETQPTRNSSDEAFAWTLTDGTTKQAIVLDDVYPATSTFKATETQDGSLGVGDFASGNLISDTNYTFAFNYQSAPLALTSGVSAALPNRTLVDEESFTLYSDAALTQYIAPDKWSYNSSTGVFTLTVDGVTDITVVALLDNAVVVFESGAAVAAGDTVYYTYEASQVCNIRAYNDMPNTVQVFNATTAAEAVGANAVSDTALHILRGYSNPSHEKTYLHKSLNPLSKVHAPVSPTRVAIDVSTVTLVAGDPLYIQTGNCTLREVAIPGAAESLNLSLGFSTGELLGNDRLVAQATRLISAEVTGSLGGVEMDVADIIEGTSHTSAGTVAASDRVYSQGLEASLCRTPFTIVAKASGTGCEGIGWVVLSNCILTNIDSSFSYGQFYARSLTATAFRDLKAVGDDTFLVLAYVESDTDAISPDVDRI